MSALDKLIDSALPNPEKCDYCGWPLSDSPKDGCTTDNCSMRPRPGDPVAVKVRQDARLARSELAALRAEVERLRAQTAGPFRVRLVCCGKDDGAVEAASWADAERIRDAYTSGAGVADHGYSAGPSEPGHRRAAIIVDVEVRPEDVRDEALSTAFWERDSNAVLLGRAEQVRDEALGLLREWQSWVEGGNTSAGDIEDRTKALLARAEEGHG